MDDKEALRKEMVEEQIIRRGGITDPLVLSSLRTVPRHLFVPPSLEDLAYSDGPLPIGEGQTISQPYIVALMTQLAHLKSSSRVLEIGTGSGYAAAVLSRICSHVYTIERIQPLAQEASTRFQRLGYFNIYTKIGDGTLGWPEQAPFDAILVTAGSPAAPKSLLQQLKPQGRLIIPIGDIIIQELRVYQRLGDEQFSEQIIESVRFVPLIGKEGWVEDQPDLYPS